MKTAFPFYYSLKNMKVFFFPVRPCWLHQIVTKWHSHFHNQLRKQQNGRRRENKSLGTNGVCTCEGRVLSETLQRLLTAVYVFTAASIWDQVSLLSFSTATRRVVNQTKVSFTRLFDWEFSCPRQQSLCCGGKKRESLQFDIAIPLRVRHLRPFPSCHNSSYFHLKKKKRKEEIYNFNV